MKIYDSNRPYAQVVVRLMRWRLRLEESDYEIVYKAGKRNVNADALSRVPIEQVIDTNKSKESPLVGSPIVLKPFRDKRGRYRHVINNRDEKLQLLKEYHGNQLGGHQGHKRTLAALKLKYYWPKMKQDKIEYVNTCKSCNQRKTTPLDRKPAPVQLSVTPSRPFQNVADIVEPLPRTTTGNRYMLTF